MDWFNDSSDSTQMKDWIWAIYILMYDLSFSKPNWFGHFGRILPSFHRTRFRWPKAGNGTHSSSGYLTSGTHCEQKCHVSILYKATHFSSVDDSPKQNCFPVKWDDSLSNKLLRHPCPLLPQPRPSCLRSSGRSFIHGRVDQLLVIGDGHPTFIRESKPLLMGIQTLTIGLMTIPYSKSQKPHLLLQNSQSALSMSQPRSAPGGHRDFEKWLKKRDLWFFLYSPPYVSKTPKTKKNKKHWVLECGPQFFQKKVSPLATHCQLPWIPTKPNKVDLPTPNKSP